MKKKWLYPLYLTLVTLLLTEVGLRLLGHRPYKAVPFTLKSTPSQNLIPHPKLGLALNPGTYRVSINSSPEYVVTHGEDSLRVTPKVLPDMTPDIGFFGCSFTYGMGVDDDETFVALLQEEFPVLNLKNYGVPGFGTIQGYLQLQQLVKEHKAPDEAFFMFCDFHMERNALLPSYRQALGVGFKRASDSNKVLLKSAIFPYATLEDQKLEIQAEPWENLYSQWPGRETFTLIQFLQNIRDRGGNSSINEGEVTVALFEEIRDFCDKNNIQLRVAGLTHSARTTEILESLENARIKTLPLQVDLSDPTLQNHPYDTHPNAKAHEKLARRLHSFISTESMSPSS